ncbi:MAG: hypothetical protein ACF8MJ_03255 [Phycisphaerales bacterium JB050]
MAQQSTEQADASQINALPEYEQTLLDLAQRDAERAINNPEERAARSVALWMADQVAEHARRADLDPSFTRLMQNHAKQIREKVLAVPSGKATKRW